MKAIFTYLIKAPLSILYGIVVYIRNKFYDWGIFKSTQFDFPIINVGNLTVGGTGKTPHVEFLLSLLSSEYKTSTLSRGYKRKSKGFRYVECLDSTGMVGDEPLQIKQKYPQAIVAVEVNRVKGIKKLIKENNGLQVIILDDAFQHRRVNTDANIVLVDYNRPVYSDHLLPWGRLRDNKSQMKRAEIVIITKCPDDIQPVDLRMITKYMGLRPYQELFFTTLEYGEKEPIFNTINLPEILADGEGAVAVSGIASPTPFLNYVKKRFGKTISLSYPDHHDFKKSDIQRICKLAKKAAVVLTTEKDSVRLRQWADIIPDDIKVKLFYIPVKVKFLKDEHKFTKLILNYVRTNKINSLLY